METCFLQVEWVKILNWVSDSAASQHRETQVSNDEDLKLSKTGLNVNGDL
jgi:hypothetical protein